MLNFDSTLQSQLNAATSKLDWTNKLLAALGTNLKIRCRRVDDASSTAVFTNGVEFYNATLSDTILTNAGALVNFGHVINTTVQLAANLSTGASVLRIEGATHWMEGTLGLSNSSCDFRCGVSPNGKASIAFGTISISAPRALPSGVGPVAPTLDANAPAFVELIDWSNPAIPVSVKIIPFDIRKDDFAYQDVEMATEMGDIRVTQSSQTIVYGQFEFGIAMMSIHGGLNLDTPGTPVHQVMINNAPYNMWPSFPFADTFRSERDLNYPKPYKLKIYNAQMVVLKTIEMHDGLAVNDATLAQYWGCNSETAVHTSHLPMRPHFNTGQLHFWQSAKLKYNSKALHYMPGVMAQDLRNSICKQQYASNAWIPDATTDQCNGAAHYYALPEYPIQDTLTGSNNAAADALDTFDDPYLWDYRAYAGYLGVVPRIGGWNYEPGARMGHEWYQGPGGPRHDRAVFSTPLVRYFSNPTGTRMKGNVPNRTLLDMYNHGYFHHSHHYFTDVKNFTALPGGMINGVGRYPMYMHAYYNQGPINTIDRAIDLGLDKLSGVIYPRDGHATPWSHWQLDNQHSYVSPGMGAIFCNSPALAVSQAHRLMAHVACQLGEVPPVGDAIGDFLSRVQAWRWMQLVVSWKTATTHSMGIDRETIEKRLQGELEGTYDAIYKPAYIDNDQSMFGFGIRTYGRFLEVMYPYVTNPWKGTKWIGVGQDSKKHYFNGTLVMMRQTGCWAAMAKRSAKCATVLKFMIDCLDKAALGSLYYTNGNYEAEFCLSPRVPDTGPDPDYFKSWAEWDLTYNEYGLITMMTDANGNPTSRLGATDGGILQWPYLRRDFFPEFPNDLIQPCIDKIDKWQNDFAAAMVNNGTQQQQGSRDHTYLWPGHGRLLPPDNLTPLS